MTQVRYLDILHMGFDWSRETSEIAEKTDNFGSQPLILPICDALLSYKA